MLGVHHDLARLCRHLSCERLVFLQIVETDVFLWQTKQTIRNKRKNAQCKRKKSLQTDILLQSKDASIFDTKIGF